MATIVWISDSVIDAIHEAQLAEHGGLAGLRDAGLLASALARPKNLASYEHPDLAACAAAYGFGIARNHPFLDGNKRTAFVVVELFLNLNGHSLNADDVDCVLTMLKLAEGALSEKKFADWIRKHLQPESG